jgi:hypothetical protein
MVSWVFQIKVVVIVMIAVMRLVGQRGDRRESFRKMTSRSRTSRRDEFDRAL